MRKEIFTTYAPDTDMSFIMADSYDENEKITATECIGWYFGEPDDNATIAFSGKLKAEY